MTNLLESNHEPRRGRRPRLPGGAKPRFLTSTRVGRIALVLLMAGFMWAVAPLAEETLMAQTSVTASAQAPAKTLTPAQMNDSMMKLQTELLAKYGEGQKARIRTGLHQVVEFWRPEDGDATVFESFVRANFAGDQESIDTMFERYQRLLEQLDGYNHNNPRA